MVKEISRAQQLHHYLQNVSLKTTQLHQRDVTSAIVSASQSSKGFCCSILDLVTLPVRKIWQFIKWITCCN